MKNGIFWLSGFLLSTCITNAAIAGCDRETSDSYYVDVTNHTGGHRYIDLVGRCVSNTGGQTVPQFGTAHFEVHVANHSGCYDTIMYIGAADHDGADYYSRYKIGINMCGEVVNYGGQGHCPLRLTSSERTREPSVHHRQGKRYTEEGVTTLKFRLSC